MTYKLGNFYQILTLSVEIVEKKEKLTFHSHKVFFCNQSILLCKLLESQNQLFFSFSSRDILNSFFYFIFKGSLPNILFVQSTIIELLELACKNDMIYLMRALECEMIKLIWRRQQTLKYESFDSFLKKFFLKDINQNVERVMKNVYEQVNCKFLYF